jgi:hypothetical protein
MDIFWESQLFQYGADAPAQFPDASSPQQDLVTIVSLGSLNRCWHHWMEGDTEIQSFVNTSVKCFRRKLSSALMFRPDVNHE